MPGQPSSVNHEVWICGTTKVVVPRHHKARREREEAAAALREP